MHRFVKPITVSLIASLAVVAACKKTPTLEQAKCQELIDHADKCSQAGVKAKMEAWCKANVGKTFDEGIMEFKFGGFLGETCERLPGRLPEFDGWSGNAKE